MAEKYTDRFHAYTSAQIKYNTNNDAYDIFEGEGTVPDYQVGRNDFNYQAFLSNLVIRWEYNPGSTIYLVWNQTRYGGDDSGMMDYFNNINSLFGVKPTNIFQIKFSYRFGLK
jgi:hypothetical protein